MNQTEAAAPAAAGMASLFGSIWALANEAAAAIFGVPIGVLLAAAAGSFFGRTFLPAETFARALLRGLGWTAAGAYTVPLALHYGGMPAQVSAGVAFILGGVLQFLVPALIPVLQKHAPEGLAKWLARWTGQ